MLLPLNHLLPLLRPRLLELVSQEAWQSVGSLAGGLPPVWTAAMLEVRLGPAERRVDFLVSTRDVGQPALAAALAGGHLLPAAEPVLSLLAEWAQPETLLGRSAPSVCLEYDLPEGHLHPPFVFLGNFDYDGSGERVAPPAPELRKLVRRSRFLLADDRADDSPCELIERISAALPPGGWIRFFASEWPSRPTADMRVVALVPFPQVLPWLRRIGWPGEDRDWENLRRIFGDSLPHLQVHVDAGDRVRPRLGLEFPMVAPPDEGGCWSAFLERLVQAGLASREKAAAMLDWAGSESVCVPGDAWRIRVQREALVKLVFDEGGALSAKGYVMFQAHHALF
jgi:hypothetical protein